MAPDHMWTVVWHGVLYKKKKGSWGIRVVFIAMCICSNIKVHNNALDRKVESCWIKI